MRNVFKLNNVIYREREMRLDILLNTLKKEIKGGAVSFDELSNNLRDALADVPPEITHRGAKSIWNFKHQFLSDSISKYFTLDD
jgi:hypothetical protein